MTCGHTIANSRFVLQGQSERMCPSSNNVNPVRCSRRSESKISPVALCVAGSHSAFTTEPPFPRRNPWANTFSPPQPMSSSCVKFFGLMPVPPRNAPRSHPQ